MDTDGGRKTQRDGLTTAVTVAAAAVGLLLIIGTGIGAWRYLTTAPAYTMPRPVLPSPNAFDYYLHAGQTLARIPNIDNVADLTRPPNEVAQQVVQAQTALQEFRAGTRFPYRTPLPPNLSTAPFHYLKDFRSLARVLAAESRLAASAGDRARALQRALEILRLGGDVPRGGTLIHLLTGQAIEVIGLSELTALGDRLNASQCRRTAVLLAALERRRPLLSDALGVEHASLREWLAPGGGLAAAHSVVFNAKGAAREVDRYFAEGVRQAALPAGKRTPIARPRHYLMVAFVQEFPRTFLVSDIKLARFRILRVELALRAYRLEHGKAPARLEDLVPQYLAAVPADPLGTGGPLLYRAGLQAYAYSVGPDGRDDGGRLLLWRDAGYAGAAGDLLVRLGTREARQPRPGAATKLPSP